MRRATAIGLLVIAVLLLAISSGAAGPFDVLKDKIPTRDDIPDPAAKAKEEARKRLQLQIPDLSRILNEPPGLTMSFEDAVTGVPFLDDFDPPLLAPMCQLPITPDGDFLVALPGLYELEAQSYCLHAGAHGPGQGEGYLYAQLKGSQAGLISNLLSKSMSYQEIPQHHIQSLIWGIQAKTKISDMPQELQEVAGKLLTSSEIRKLNGGALGMVPEELFGQAFIDLPDPLRRIKEAEANLRYKLTQDVYDFAGLEQLAVLSGDPEPVEGGPVVPRGRWSYDPAGFLVRYFPHGYSQTTVQLYRPENFQIQADELGRITLIADHYGNRIETSYDDTVPPLRMTHDDDTKGYAFKLVRLVSPDPANPGQMRHAEWHDVGWTLVGVPTERGRPDDPPERFADARRRYKWGQEHLAQINELAGHFPNTSERSDRIARLMCLGHYSEALRSVAADQGTADASWVTDHIAMVKKAWQSDLAILLGGTESETQTARAGGLSFDGIMLAAFPLARGLWGHNSAPRPTLLAQGGYGPGRGIRPSRYRPSGGGLMPASRDRQRLGSSGRSHPLPGYQPPADGSPPSGGSGKETYNRAKDAIGWIGNGKTAVDVIASPAQAAAGSVGFAIPQKLFGYILDWNFDTWGKASAALGSDPPRDDYTVLAQPEPLTLPSLAAGDGLSAQRAAAASALMQGMGDLLAMLRAGQVTMDRLGGAMQAGDEEWTARQAALLIDFKRQAGQKMIVVSYQLENLLQVLRDEGIQDLTVTAEALVAYQERLRTQGFSDEEVQAARTIGLTDAELQACLQQRLQGDPEEMAGNLMEGAQQLAVAMRNLGLSWSTLPAAG